MSLERRAIFGQATEEDAQKHAAMFGESPTMIVEVIGRGIGELDGGEPVKSVFFSWPTDQFCPCCGKTQETRSGLGSLP